MALNVGVSIAYSGPEWMIPGLRSGRKSCPSPRLHQATLWLVGKLRCDWCSVYSTKALIGSSENKASNHGNGINSILVWSRRVKTRACCTTSIGESVISEFTYGIFRFPFNSTVGALVKYCFFRKADVQILDILSLVLLFLFFFLLATMSCSFVKCIVLLWTIKRNGNIISYLQVPNVHLTD